VWAHATFHIGGPYLRFVDYEMPRPSASVIISRDVMCNFE
jgi:hypothetical protein